MATAAQCYVAGMAGKGKRGPEKVYPARLEVRINEKMRRDLDWITDDQNISISDIVRNAIAYYIEVTYREASRH